MNKIVLILIISLISSCVPLKWELEDKFTSKFDGVYTGLDLLINTNGFYHNDDSELNIGFYCDGTCFTINSSSKYLTKDATFILYNEKKDEVSGNSFAPLLKWGHYIIKNDTIIIQVVGILGGGIRKDCIEGGPIYIYYYKLIILDKSNLELIEEKVIDKKYENSIKNSNNILTFVKFKNMPDSNCWLKKYPWAWKDGKIIK